MNSTTMNGATVHGSTMNNSIVKKLLQSDAGLAALVLRVPVGLVLAAHGAQKLFAWFGGYGLEGTGQWMASIGLEPGYLMALLAGSAEFFGGLALALAIQGGGRFALDNLIADKLK